ncbi:MAG TPA: YdiU family protein, partial [Mycobacterium sp.]|nr:YdiU family protein [Mycobacterium sp.]
RELPELAIRWQAEAAPDPQLLVLNDGLADELGLDAEWLRGPDGLRLLTGNLVPAGATPVAQAYAGHQFGGYVPRLGDGRALLLGELTTTTGELRDLHLKGSGATPFARGGDGLAAVGPMLREYIVSEAMHALGIPTTRSLAVVATGRQVQRETPLPGAVLARVARSHLRVGTFQYAANTGDVELVRRLADHAIDRHHPAAATAENPYVALFESVLAVQATLVAQWMLVGFVHGVMNTDNMTISGETIDYGPCAFMEAYDPETVFSSIDSWGRYAYGNQPSMAAWNLARLAEALLPLFADDQEHAVAVAQGSLGRFGERFQDALSAGMRAKLGLSSSIPDEVAVPVMNDLVAQLHQSHVDFTSFFRMLAGAARGDAEPARGLFLDLAAFDEWLARWRALKPDADMMARVNPVYIPRNHLVEEALIAATTDGDLAPLHRLLAAVTAPYDEQPGLERYAEPAPEDFGKYRTFCGT